MSQPKTDSEKQRVRSLFLNGPAGRLEAVLNLGSGLPARAGSGQAMKAGHAALVCHPHPVYGGTMHNKVVFQVMKALNHFGLPVLRFNFRGTGLSQGEFDNGRGEIEDVRAALEWLYAEFRLPIVLAGFSFGALTGLKAASPDPRVPVLISVGTPIGQDGQREYDYDFLQGCSKSKLFVSGDRDQFAARPELENIVAALPEPKTLKFIRDADHFFDGKLGELQKTIENWMESLGFQEFLGASDEERH